MSAPDLRLGRYQDVLRDVECDASIADPPFSKRCHEGYRTGANPSDEYGRAQVDYAHWTAEGVHAYVKFVHERTRGWIVALTDSDLANDYREAFESVGRLHFQPLPCVMPGMTCRLTGDGPSSEAIYAMVSRPRSKAFAQWGTLPGFYLTRQKSGAIPAGKARGGGGGRGKPLDLMRALVKDYSRPGDLICDPTAGYGTTGVAALGMGRRFVGSEVDAAAFAEAGKRLAGAQVVDLFDPERAKQAPLFDVPARAPRAPRRKKAA